MNKASETYFYIMHEEPGVVGSSPASPTILIWGSSSIGRALLLNSFTIIKY